jgi:uncharacterized protein (TIGR03437 family)
VKTFFAIILTLGLLAASGAAQPTVALIVNAASSSQAPLPNSSIAQGSYFTIYGTGIGPATSACGANLVSCIWNPYPLPTAIMGASVSVTVGGTTVAAYPQFVSSGQINAVLPSNTPTGSGTLTVTYNGTPSNAFDITVAPSSFGTFAWDEEGTGPGIFTNAISYQLLTPFSSAKPGDYVTIWGTGLGPAPNLATEATAAPTQTNLCATAASCPVTVWVGGLQATVTYAGRSGFTAEDQIDFQVPTGALGCYVQVAVETTAGTNSVVGNFTSLPVDPSGATCSDLDGINYADIASLVQTNGHANVGDMILLSNYLNLSIPILGAAQWDNDTVSGEVGTFTAGTLEAFQGFTLAPSVNNCTVSPFLQFPPAPDPALANLPFLNAGTSLSIQGPSGSPVSVPMNKNGNGYYGLVGGVTIAQLETVLTTGACPTTSTDNCLPFFLTPAYGITAGTYTVTGTGGSAVGALSAPITVTPAAASFQWTNQSSVTATAIPRDQSLTITWTGGDPNGFVDITAIASTLQSGTAPLATTPGVLVECMAPSQAGKFTIPPYVLQALPSTVNSTALVPPGELLVGPASGAVKATTLPTGLDALYIVYHFIQGQNVSWQ